MKRLFQLITLSLSATLCVGCSALMNSSSYGTNDLYRSNNRTEVANDLRAQAEAEKAEAEARQAMWEARLAEANAAGAEQAYYASTSTPSYTSVVADTYESAYAHRLQGFNTQEIGVCPPKKKQNPSASRRTAGGSLLLLFWSLLFTNRHRKLYNELAPLTSI